MIYEVFLDPAGVLSWRIMGETLEQWGTTPSEATSTITFTKLYANTFFAGRASPVGSKIECSFAPQGVGSVAFAPRDDAGNTAATAKTWYTIGQWDGVS